MSDRAETREGRLEAIVTPQDLRNADAAYEPFAPFSDWEGCDIPDSRWEEYWRDLEPLRETGKTDFEQAVRIVRRAAAVNTGALEKLYEADAGFTFTVATEAAILEYELASKGPDVKGLLRGQLDAYDQILDFATGAQPLAEAWIRQLHTVLTQGQDTYQAVTEVGIQSLRLPKGQYKTLPNHVREPDGEIHSYAPVDLTTTEMHRLCTEFRAEAFMSAHPALQAAYVHHALAKIHPFADGNGRVARALASVFPMKAWSVPVLILADQRTPYLEALRAADSGDFQPFTSFTYERCLDALLLAKGSLDAAATPTTESTLAQIRRLFSPRGGYTHQEVDTGGSKLFQLFAAELQKEIDSVKEAGLQFTIAGAFQSRDGLPEIPQSAPVRTIGSPGAQMFAVTFQSQEPPVAVSHVERFEVLVPKDGGAERDLEIRSTRHAIELRARMSEVLPEPNAQLIVRLRVLAEKSVREALAAFYLLLKRHADQQGHHQ